MQKRDVLLLGLWNTILRIVSFDYNVLSALGPDLSGSNFEKAGGSLPGDGSVKWQFANACKVSVTEGGGTVAGASGRKWGESGRCRQYPGLAATLSSRSRQAGCVWWRGRAVSDTQYGSWHSQHQVRQVISVSCQWPERGPSEAPDPGVTPSECELTTGG